MTSKQRAAQIIPKATKESISAKESRMKAIEENKTDKKYTLFFLNKPLMNWDHVEFLREALRDLPKKSTTFIHYNEGGINDYCS